MNTFLYTGTDEGVNKIYRLKERGWLELLERAQADLAPPAWYAPLLAYLGDALIGAGTRLKNQSAAFVRPNCNSSQTFSETHL